MIDLELESMIQLQLVTRGITDQALIRAYRRISRKVFVPEYLHHRAYANEVLPIGLGQTISSPYSVARMLQDAQIRENSRVLEIGTGSGYQTALLASLAKEVYSVECVPELSARARKVLCDDMGFSNVSFRVGDGFQGWSDEAPFDAVVVSAAAEEVPWPLLGQLRLGGRLVMPIGSKEQHLAVVERGQDGEVWQEVPHEEFASTFSPMVGEAAE